MLRLQGKAAGGTRNTSWQPARHHFELEPRAFASRLKQEIDRAMAFATTGWLSFQLRCKIAKYLPSPTQNESQKVLYPTILSKSTEIRGFALYT